MFFFFLCVCVCFGYFLLHTSVHQAAHYPCLHVQVRKGPHRVADFTPVGDIHHCTCYQLSRYQQMRFLCVGHQNRVSVYLWAPQPYVSHFPATPCLSSTGVLSCTSQARSRTSALLLFVAFLCALLHMGALRVVSRRRRAVWCTGRTVAAIYCIVYLG